MSHWPFIIGAYAIAVGGTLAVTLASWRVMRNAEVEADKLGAERMRRGE